MTDRDLDAYMHAPVGGPVADGSEREVPRTTRARDTRVIHEDDPPAQVLIRDFVSLHASEAVSAVQAGWPFRNVRPAHAELLRLVGRLSATPVRAAGVLLVVLLTALITLAAHAAA